MLGGGGKSDRIFYFFIVLALHAFYLNYKVYNLEIALEDALNHIRNHPTPTAPIIEVKSEPHKHQPSKEEGKIAKFIAKSQFLNFAFNNPKSPPSQVPEKVSVEESKAVNRGFYGGEGDKSHLGGFTYRDNSTISYNLWRFLMSEVAVKSMVDVGCGKGHSTKFFYDQGVDVLCVEGSHDAIKQSLLPRKVIVQHDYTKGPWWPDTKTYDLAWSTEFLEHVGRQYMENYLPVFLRSAIVVVTSSPWGGWHHVEVHHGWWWKARFEARGLVYSEYLTDMFKRNVRHDFEKYRDQGYSQTLMGMYVFINPYVASLPEHRHLFGGNGCYNGVVDNENGGEPCEGVDALPVQYHSILQCTRWRNDSISPLPEYIQSPWTCKNEKNSPTFRHFRG